MDMRRIDAARAARCYTQMNIQTAPRGKILLSLYDAAIRDARATAEFIRKNDLEAKAKTVRSVCLILGELAAALNHAAAPELCRDLAGLYAYMQTRLAQAHAHMDPAPAEEVAGLLDVLRDGWRQVLAPKTDSQDG